MISGKRYRSWLLFAKLTIIDEVKHGSLAEVG